MPRTTMVFLVLACMSGATAFGIMRGYVARLDALQPAVGPPVAVVHAVRSVSRGDIVAADDVALAETPSSFALDVALRTTADAVGRVALTDLAIGEIVTATRLSDGRTGPLASLVPPGMRAVVVAIATPIDGLVPGDRVDVIATASGERSYAETVGASLEVLRPPERSTDALGGDGPGASVVVLADPETAERLARAEGYASLSITVLGSQAMDPSAETDGG